MAARRVGGDNSRLIANARSYILKDDANISTSPTAVGFGTYLSLKRLTPHHYRMRLIIGRVVVPISQFQFRNQAIRPLEHTGLLALVVITDARVCELLTDLRVLHRVLDREDG